ncbi:DUF6221 family protein [Micromonospora tulbaghiae]|uniref:DUF6221 family protein n=1 Tax=Micromonospora tulbaghiae TaxID=479978 RepID=UPI0033290D65
MIDDELAMVAWGRAQLDEDERRAQAASDGPWRVGKVDHGSASVVDKDGHDVIPEDVDYGTVVALADCEHVVRYDPVWALARVAGLRAVLGLYETNLRVREENAQKLARLHGTARLDAAWGAEVGQLRAFGLEVEDRVVALRDVVRLQLVEYAGRPGYREQWRPVTDRG